MNATEPTTEVKCPKCGGPMWDERAGQFWGNGKTQSGKDKPAYKCKAKKETGCDGAVWANQLVGPLRQAPVRERGVLPFNGGGGEQTLEQQIDQVTKSDPQATLEFSAPLYKGIVTYVMAEIVPLLEKTKSEQYSVCAADIFAASATLYIAATRNGAWQGQKT